MTDFLSQFKKLSAEHTERMAQELVDMVCAGLTEVATLNSELLAMLEELEWVTDLGGTFCPYCMYWKHDSHSLNCKLGNLLKKVREEGG